MLVPRARPGDGVRIGRRARLTASCSYSPGMEPHARFEAPLPAGLDAAQREVYDAVSGGPRASAAHVLPLADGDGRLLGPFGPMLLSPSVGGALQDLGARLRYGTALSDRARELAILLVAAHEDSAFERYAHELIGRHVGLSESELEALRGAAVPPLDDPHERAVMNVVGALLLRGDLDDDEYETGRQRLGAPVLFELMTLVGYYRTLALQLRVLRIVPPPVQQHSPVALDRRV